MYTTKYEKYTKCHRATTGFHIYPALNVLNETCELYIVTLMLHNTIRKQLQHVINSM